MADPLSIAASAIAVAGAGFKLAETLYSFIDNVRKADKHLRPIAQHVELTSAILENVGSLLRTDEIRSLCQAKLLRSTEQALKGCQGAFRELEDYLKGLMKVKKDGSRGLNTWDKATWGYRQKEIDVLQAHLERFKSSLELVFSVLNLISSTRNQQKSPAETDGLKAQISMLIKALDVAKAKDDAASRQAQGVSVLDPVNGNTKAEQTTSVNSGDLPTKSGARDLTGVAMLAPEKENHGPTQADIDTEGSSELIRDQAQSQGNDELLLHLSKCAEAVASLASSLQAATKLWQTQNQYERECIAQPFAVVQQSVMRLRYFEAHFEPPSKKQRFEGPATSKASRSKSYRIVGMSFAVSVNLLGAGLLALLVPRITAQWLLLTIFAGLNMLAFGAVLLLAPATVGASDNDGRPRMVGLGVEQLFYIYKSPRYPRYIWKVYFKYLWSSMKIILSRPTLVLQEPWYMWVQDPKNHKLVSNDHTALQLFDEHAAACWVCGGVYKRYQRGERICAQGTPLADDVCSRVRYDGGGIYVALQRERAPVLIHMPAQFPFAVDLLEAVAYHGKPSEPSEPQKRDRMPTDTYGRPGTRADYGAEGLRQSADRLRDGKRVDAMRIDRPSAVVEHSDSREGHIVTKSRRGEIRMSRDTSKIAGNRRSDGRAPGRTFPELDAAKEEPTRADAKDANSLPEAAADVVKKPAVLPHPLHSMEGNVKHEDEQKTDGESRPTRDSYGRERRPPTASDTRDSRRRRHGDSASGISIPAVDATTGELMRAEDFSVVDELLRSWTLLDV